MISLIPLIWCSKLLLVDRTICLVMSTQSECRGIHVIQVLIILRSPSDLYHHPLVVRYIVGNWLL
ncbi:hypothetical protein M758_7G000700 [Ceratodon purpureus]|uniref:Uncharacterized protein n=1 Tax=Ceratodon purpureus TaxID=3225 RepID=A0A8T0H331_CERPU|nr:hypothetical protein KC19_7G000700 [Ceratodon purpureus]KAG0609610.1 hypothetical protein M758_7G000700 [Ceratodon purpureus]